MASPSTTADVVAPPKSAESDNYLTHDKGVTSWIFTLDHKRIGVMYLASVLAAFALGGLFALLVRTELLTPGKTIVEHNTYNQFFTLHGAIMVFLVIIPGIPAALGNIIMPLQLGAKDVAFPRLNLASYHLWIIGALCMLSSLVINATDTGWTFYAPYSTTTETAVVPAAFGAFILGFSSIFTGLNFIVTIHKMRPPGMTWFRMPLFIWALYSTALIQVLATPVIGITLLMMIVERTLHIGIFDPALGGDPVLFQHFFWFYSHPAVYIMIVPAFGVISEIIPVFSRKKMFGYQFIAVSSLAIAFLGFLVWGHHMFTSGQSVLAGSIFSAITFLIAIPTAIKVFNWISTMYKGPYPPRYAHAVRPRVPLGVHHRRAHRRVPGRDERGRAPSRHLLRGGALPLRDDGRRDHRAHGRHPLLVAEDVREDVRREARAHRLVPRLRRPRTSRSSRSS